MIRKVEIQIEGTHCPGCKARIEAKVGHLKGVKQIDVDYGTGSVFSSSMTV